MHVCVCMCVRVCVCVCVFSASESWNHPSGTVLNQEGAR